MTVESMEAKARQEGVAGSSERFGGGLPIDPNIKNYFTKRMNASKKSAEKLYVEGDMGFRGFREV